MKVTYKEALNNKWDLVTISTTLGWIVRGFISGKHLSCYSTNKEAVQNWNADAEEKVDRVYRITKGCKELLSELIEKNK